MAEESQPGLIALRGFAYQIKVFLFFFASLKEGEQIEFETIDDLAMNGKDSYKLLESKSESFCQFFSQKGERIAIQVKQTKVTNTLKEKILMNWLLLKHANKGVSKFVLFSDSSYNLQIELFSQDLVNSLWKKIVSPSKKRSDSLLKKTGLIYQGEKSKFVDDLEEINKCHNIILTNSLEEKILGSFSESLHRTAIQEERYRLRVKELGNCVLGQIIRNASEKKPYICNFSEKMTFIEDVCQRINNEIFCPDFSVFKRINQVDLRDPKVMNSREFKQLSHCFTNQKSDQVVEHLVFQLYYEYIRFRNYEDNRGNLSENIENITYGNFCDAKDRLNANGNDSPKLRLIETKCMGNSYCKNEQIRFGSCIYLTREEIEQNKKVSWKDEDED